MRPTDSWRIDPGPAAPFRAARIPVGRTPRALGSVGDSGPTAPTRTAPEGVGSKAAHEETEARMFLPLEIEHSYGRTPFATIAIAASLVIVAIATGFSPDESTLLTYALVPSAFQVHQLFTAAFLHLGFLHLLFNVCFLLVFGRYVEDRLGAWRFAVVYVACAVFGNLVQLAVGGAAIALGASGAIAGLLGYVLVAAPWAEVRCVLLLFGPAMGRHVEIAAAWLLGLWVVLQLVEASLGSMSSVAVGAHLGGFALGAAGAAIMRSDRCKGTGWYIDPRPPQGGRAAVDRLRRARA